MGLFNLFAPKKKTKIKVDIKGYEDGKEVILKEEVAPDEIHPMSYYQTIEKEIKPLEAIVTDFAVALKNIRDKDDRVEVLTALVESYYALKEKCETLGPDYQKLFSKRWEHCHNSRNPDFCFVDRFEEELKKLKEEK